MANLIMEGYRGILSGTDERTKDALDYVSACLNPDTPSHAISIMGFVTKTFSLYRQVNPKDAERFEELGYQVENVLRERGYRTDIYTFQEHKIMGSTQWIGYAEQPYKPIGILKGELAIKEAGKARQLQKIIWAFGSSFCLPDDRVQVSLEPLDDEGNTIGDPRILNEMLEPMPTQYRQDFPFMRAR